MKQSHTQSEHSSPLHTLIGNSSPGVSDRNLYKNFLETWEPLNGNSTCKVCALQLGIGQSWTMTLLTAMLKLERKSSGRKGEWQKRVPLYFELQEQNYAHNSIDSICYSGPVHPVAGCQADQLLKMHGSGMAAGTWLHHRVGIHAWVSWPLVQWFCY